MQYGSITNIDKPISRLVQGTLAVSSPDIEKSFALLDEFFALGCNTFDTAHVYEKGESERTLGRWVSSRGLRDQLVIITKGAHPNGDQKRVTPADITSDLIDSLERLQTDHIDMYLLHRDDPAVPVGPIIEVLNEHLEAGRIRAFGGSNWTVERLQEANEYARAHHLTPFAASSPNFSLAEQVKAPWPGCISLSGTQGEAARDWYQRAGIPLFTWSSLAGGFFSGRFTRDNLDTFEDYFDRVCVMAYCYEDNFRRLERAQQLAAQKGLSLAQVALAYVLSHPLNTFTIVGCRSGAEFRENIAASEMRLSEAEMEWLELKRDGLDG